MTTVIQVTIDKYWNYGLGKRWTETFKLYRCYPWQKWMFLEDFEMYQEGDEWDGAKIKVNKQYTIPFSGGDGYSKFTTKKLNMD